MKHRVTLTLFLASLLATAAACQGRTAAATQTTPAAFDPAASDPKALAAVDEMVTALGGADKWAQVKQLRWDVRYLKEGQLKGWFKHSWDIWNGRHRYEFAPPAQLASPEPVFTIAMYDLFDRQGRRFVSNTLNPTQNALAEDRERIVNTAYEAWLRDSYQIAMLYKLRDPGVKLTYVGTRNDFPDHCKPSCVDIKVSFDARVGKDVYHLYINSETKMPEVVEHVLETGRLTMGMGDWVEVQGLKFPGSLKNLGPDEVFKLENIQIGEPEEELYVPQVLG